VLVPDGVYRLGDGGERTVAVDEVLIGRWPVTTGEFGAFVADTKRSVSTALRRRLESEQLADHPVTEVTFADAIAFCAWSGGRLPLGDEWEAAARGVDGHQWPWGDTFDPERCNCVESGWGWTVPVHAHPQGASPCCAEQMAGNVWEWVGDAPDEDGWRMLRGGSYLDTAWGVRCARTLSADPDRRTATTGFRLAIEQ